VTTRFWVDLDLLDEVVRSLGQHHDQLELLEARLAEVVGRLHDEWVGAAALAHSEAQEQWDAGFAVMRSALSDMRAAAAVAHRNYGLAAEANVALWRELT
jgi:WXG100 family type VII secretion target